jgi:hypothetical protein
MQLINIFGLVLAFAVILIIIFNSSWCQCTSPLSEEMYTQTQTQIATENQQEEQQLYFLTKEEASELLSKDEDQFYKTFFQADLHARRVQNITQYIDLIKEHGVDNFSEEEKQKVQQAISLSINFLNQINLPWLNGKKAAQGQWNIAKSTSVYEEGLPHTRGSVIILSTYNLQDDIETLSRTLTHERLHVYQKKYPEEVKTYLLQHGFVIKRKRQEEDLIRANPDVDTNIYVDEKNGVEIKCQYTSTTPRSILDVKNSNQFFEHPFERMVIDIIIQ